MMQNYFHTLKRAGEGLYKEKGSKFISFSLHVVDVDAVEQKLTELRQQFYDARHHCYAYVLGTGQNETYRANDDGEPNHSAGDPILGQIRSMNLTDTLVVVIRYFGGTKLGVSGLIHAYKTAAAEALKNSGTRKIFMRTWYSIKYPYDSTNEVMRLINDSEAEVGEQEFTENCLTSVGILIDKTAEFEAAYNLLQQTGVSVEVTKMAE